VASIQSAFDRSFSAAYEGPAVMLLDLTFDHGRAREDTE